MAQAGLSALFAAAICLAVGNVAFLASGQSIGESLQWSSWLAGITLGLTWAVTHFGALAGRKAQRQAAARQRAD